jgi:hypothetical protein
MNNKDIIGNMLVGLVAVSLYIIALGMYPVLTVLCTLVAVGFSNRKVISVWIEEHR